MIGLIDYRMGNIQSVVNSLEAVKAQVKVIHQPEELSEVNAIVLPGVGAFGDGMRNLKQFGFEDALREHVLEDGKPLLGICLGLQLLATCSNEHGLHKGLGWIPGVTTRLPNQEALQ